MKEKSVIKKCKNVEEFIYEGGKPNGKINRK